MRLLILFLLFFSVEIFSQDFDRVSGKEIVERLTRVEEGVRNLEKRYDDLNKRIDDLNKRIDDMNNRMDERFAEVNKRIDELRSLILWVGGLAIAGVFALIGFVLWDRRTAIMPVAREVEYLERTNSRTLEALREYARKNPEFAEIMRNFGLL